MMVTTVAWMTVFTTIARSTTYHLWANCASHGFLVAFLSTIWLAGEGFHFDSELFIIDKISAPLSIMTCWLFPLTLLASQGKMMHLPPLHQQIYIANAAFLQIFTLLAFTSADLMMFFVFFEASLIPTMIIITRWGLQEIRLKATNYFTIYTIVGAVPFIAWLLYSYSCYGTLKPSLDSPLMNWTTTLPPTLTWLTLNLAFLIKLPMYGFHLWLPMAHVEAPIAGSMILAATLLKLGGYGMIRTSTMLQVPLYHTALIFMLPALLGIVAAAAMCFRMANLKALIAMSSVSHMSLVIVAALLHTSWSFAGATALMITHGLTSSALFCLANTFYERTNSQTIILFRGGMVIFPLAGAWWLMLVLYNMGFPPTPSFIAETIIFTSLYAVSKILFSAICVALLFTTYYSLYMFSLTVQGAPPFHITSPLFFTIREKILIFFHVVPMLLLMIYPVLILTS
uniref:NADH dehydrogenase subunit 4 n=1 Tax=Ptychadena wadei TaxID=1342839 RepID=UPI00286BA6BB|nr:NADH dehydrogenase subunit 4 [Ptychadena wadei]WKT09048.1 NADH dehydrogenase subunit 4 [Ptychadena wadei]